VILKVAEPKPGPHLLMAQYPPRTIESPEVMETHQVTARWERTPLEVVTSRYPVLATISSTGGWQDCYRACNTIYDTTPQNNNPSPPNMNLYHRPPSQQNIFLRVLANYVGFAAAGLLFVTALIAYRTSTFVSSDTLASGIVIDSIKVGGKSISEAISMLESQPVSDQIVTIESDEYLWSTPSGSLGLRRDARLAVEQARAIGRQGPIWEQLQDIQGREARFSTGYAWNESAVQAWISVIAEELRVVGKAPTITLKKSGQKESLEVIQGITDQQLNMEETITQVLQSSPPIQPIQASLIKKEPISEIGLKLAQQRAEAYVGKKVTFQADRRRFTLQDQEIIDLMELDGGWKIASISGLINEWKKKVDREPQEPELEIKDNKVTKFSPPQNGQVLEVQDGQQRIAKTLSDLEFSSESSASAVLLVAQKNPQKSLASLNTLGIKEKIGEAESFYHHSIPGRVHNVSLTTSRISLALIAPGETFSFNKRLGEVSRRTGFRPAYVISGGRTVLGDGGGVCQVSSTTFRLALNSGLPINERKGHSYRVSYYEQNALPGLDATVYAPSPDLKFTNDTGNHILIYAEAFPDDYYMYMQMWGTSDGRKAEILDHRVYDVTGPAKTIYQEDPNLPRGTRRQVDWSASGAKTSFRYLVTKNGQPYIDETFKTVFRPWAAVYLVGTRD